MFRNILFSTTNKNIQVICCRYKQKKMLKIDRKLEAQAESLAARGFLRPRKFWEPPLNIDEIIMEICKKNGLNAKSKFESLKIKFVILKYCFDKTGYDVPNSLLHTIETVADLKEFYLTPVDTLNPFESLLSMDLPKNLHVQRDYVRFHPETDTMFGGKSAYPKSSTIVTGLKTRKKYRGYDYKDYDMGLSN